MSEIRPNFILVPDYNIRGNEVMFQLYLKISRALPSNSSAHLLNTGRSSPVMLRIESRPTFYGGGDEKMFFVRADQDGKPEIVNFMGNTSSVLIEEFRSITTMGLPELYDIYDDLVQRDSFSLAA